MHIQNLFSLKGGSYLTEVFLRTLMKMLYEGGGQNTDP